MRKQGSSSGKQSGYRQKKTGRKSLLGHIPFFQQWSGQSLRSRWVPLIPLLLIFYLTEKEAWLYRHCVGGTVFDRVITLLMNAPLAFHSLFPSLYPADLLAGMLGAAGVSLVVWYRRKNARKFRQGREYGSARWGTAKDIRPFVDPVFERNIILTETESLTMNSRPKDWRYARNKNVIVIGGSGSGKTRYYVKPSAPLRAA